MSLELVQDGLFIFGMAGCLLGFLVLIMAVIYSREPWYVRSLLFLWAFSLQAAMLALATHFDKAPK